MLSLAAALWAAGSAAALMGSASAEVPASLGTEEASALIQTVVHTDEGAYKPEFPLVPLIQWATGNEHFNFMPSEKDLKKATSVAKGVISLFGAAKTQKAKTAVVRKRTRPTKQTEQERAREAATREHLHSSMLWLMREMRVPAVVRGNIASWLMPEMLEYRRKAAPRQRLLMDNVLAIPLDDVGLANLHTKASDLIRAFDASGLTALARIVDVALPVLKLARFFSPEAQANTTQLSFAKRFAQELAAVPTIAALPQEVSQTLRELAVLFEANEGRSQPATALQLLEELKQVDPSPLVPLLADAVFLGLDVLNQTVAPAFIHDLAHLMRKSSVPLPLPGPPAEKQNVTAWAGFADDMATMMEQGRALPENQLQRVGQLVSEAHLVDDAGLAEVNAMVETTDVAMRDLWGDYAEMLEGLKNESKKTWGSIVQFALRPLFCGVKNATAVLQICNGPAPDGNLSGLNL